MSQNNWYYADQGRQVGPVEESSLDDLVRAGVVRDDTLIWQEGMANWAPHGVVRGVKPQPAPMPAPAVPMAVDQGFCSECGRPYPVSQLVAIGNASVCAQCKPLFLQRMREGGQAIGTQRFAGFWIRFVAILIDGFIMGAVFGILGFVLALVFGGGIASIASGGGAPSAGALAAMEGAIGLVYLVAFAAGIAYDVYFVSSRGATPGKMVLGLKIVRADGSPVSTGLAFGRYFAKVLSGMILYIGFIMAGVDEQKRALHDRLCETRVIHTR